MVHGDGFTALGTNPHLDRYTAEIEKVSEIQKVWVHWWMDWKTEVRILSRIVRIVPNGARYDADTTNFWSDPWVLRLALPSLLLA